MRIIKLGIISFILIFGLITLMSLFIPSQIRISRAINLGPSEKRIMNLVRDTTKWSSWHPGFMNPAGEKPMHLLKRIPVSSDSTEIIMKVQQGEKRPVTNGWKLYSYTSTDSLTLQWYMDFSLSWYPWQKFSSLFYESAYGTMMEEGLTNLKGD